MLLQNPVKVKGAATTGCKSVFPVQIVLLDSLSLGTLNIVFHAHP
jgi:hypothetical protein